MSTTTAATSNTVKVEAAAGTATPTSTAGAAPAPIPAVKSESGTEGHDDSQPGVDHSHRFHTILQFPPATNEFLRSQFDELELAHGDYKNLLARLYEDDTLLCALHDQLIVAVGRSIAPMAELSNHAEWSPITSTVELVEDHLKG